MNWGPHAKQTSPGGANEPSPALQRWVKRNNDASPGGTTDFSLMPGRPLQPQQRIPKQQISPTHILRLDRSLRLYQRVSQSRSTVLEERLQQAAIQVSLR